MNFVADEGVDFLIVQKLREDGHDVFYVAEQKKGISDETILSLASQEDRLLITRDKDFGELAYHSRKIHSGIILNRLYELHSATKAQLVSQVITQHGPDLRGCFTVIQPGRVRIKKMY